MDKTDVDSMMKEVEAILYEKWLADKPPVTIGGAVFTSCPAVAHAATLAHTLHTFAQQCSVMTYDGLALVCTCSILADLLEKNEISDVTDLVRKLGYKVTEL